MSYRPVGGRGGTDLTIILGEDEVVTFEVVVQYDLELRRREIANHFPDSAVTVTQFREGVLLEGQVRTASQASQIVNIAESWLASGRGRTGTGAAPSARIVNLLRVELTRTCLELNEQRASWFVEPSSVIAKGDIARVDFVCRKCGIRGRSDFLRDVPSQCEVASTPSKDPQIDDG